MTDAAEISRPQRNGPPRAYAPPPNELTDIHLSVVSKFTRRRPRRQQVVLREIGRQQ
ncbi:hypothetical protein EVAR_37681_1, partial [Eumeta japonica]